MRRLIAALGIALVALAAAAGPAAAQEGSSDWVIDSFDSDITVDADGTMHVVEMIKVDFRNSPHHGIFRVIPVRYPLAGDDVQLDLPEGRRADQYERAIEIDDVNVTSTAPANLVIDRPSRVEGAALSMRIGDEDRTVTGPQTYEISYRVAGALNAFEAHDELFWNVTGNEWEVPIRDTTVRVHAPAVKLSRCFEGPVGSTQPCASSDRTNIAATFSADRLRPGEGLTIVAGFPPDAVDVPAPLLIEKWTAGRALAGSPAAVPAALAVSVLGLGGLGLLLYRQGRDRVTRAGVVEGTAGDAEQQPRALFSSRVTPVEFRPPDDLRPAQIGLLIDERVDPHDISATIVDLAVRGHLTITELHEKKLFRDSIDWQLAKQSTDDPVLPYEGKLLKGLFREGPVTSVAALKGTFATDYNKAKGMLYEDAKSRGWFSRRPDKVRSVWLGIGIVLILVGFAAFVAALVFTTFALAFLPLFVIGIALTIAHRWMPRRTAKGSRLLDKVLGFRQFIVLAEAGRAEYAEQQNLFVKYLPYAVVFGAVDKWASTFANLDADAVATGVGVWYVGGYPGAFDAGGFTRGMSDFASSVGSSLPNAPAPSGGSGFSGGGGVGGGFGGGGGGGW